MSRAPPKTSQNPPNPTQPPDTSGPTRRSSRLASQSASPSAETQLGRPAATRRRPVQSATATANPSAQEVEEEDTPSTDSEATALFIIAEALDKLLSRNSLPDHISTKLRNLSRYASKAGVKECKKEIVQISMEHVRDMRKDFMADLSSNYATLEDKLSSLVAKQEQILKATDTLTKNTEGINMAAKGIEDKVTKVNDATTQIASTTKTYRDALRAQPSQPLGTMVDLRLKDDLERKAKQILVVVHGDALSGKSLMEIQSKAEEAIAEMADELDRPDKVEIETVSTTRTKAILLQLSTKQAADWLRDPFIESKFTAKFAKDSMFVDRLYSIIVPRTPITFDPQAVSHLREVEESNNLDPRTIKKARWIKPINRRREGQTHAYAVLSLTAPSTANQLIRKGITICGVKTTPFKMKHEPLQCMRCRRWGHIAAQCLDTVDTCGACGEGHSTNNCNNPHSRFCAVCMDNTHTSWDRSCPEFTRRREIYNNKHPENNLPFFPTSEEWTLTTRPDKIPFEDRFPQRFTVNDIPAKVVPRRPQQQSHPRNRSKRHNNHNNHAAPTKNNAPNGDTNTIDRYFTNTQPTATTGRNTGEEDELPGPSYRDEPANSESIVERLIGDSNNTPPGNYPI